MKKFSLIFFLFVSMSSFMGAYAQDVYIGEIRCVAFNYAPRGWALCNGQILPISQNQALFALLGTTYGGDGINTFALPNLCGRVPVGEGQGPDLPKISLGEQGGSEEVTLTTTQLPAHTHATKVFHSEATTNKPGTLGKPADLGLNPVKLYVETQEKLTSGTPTTVTGGNQPHNNRMPYVGMYWIIALEGVYPSRP